MLSDEFSLLPRAHPAVLPRGRLSKCQRFISWIFPFILPHLYTVLTSARQMSGRNLDEEGDGKQRHHSPNERPSLLLLIGACAINGINGYVLQ
ncbi:hypothetical protein ALC53_05102 [Atta colombica]|uniref:Uncharacterized protein n=1 Tax=Atta colombica TaxID=520822 RepID=A0A151I469_9HYME|nr:hypothetical protein ALC53_05102 [Atta colombica]